MSAEAENPMLPFAEPLDAAVQRIDGEILHLLMGGEFCGLDLDSEEKSVLRLIRFRRGAANTIPIRELHEQTKFSPRAIKEIVRTLRLNFRLPIGSSKRGQDGGYYLMVTRDDVNAWIKTFAEQIRAEAEVVRAVGGSDAVRELLGQLTLEDGHG